MTIKKISFSDQVWHFSIKLDETRYFDLKITWLRFKRDRKREREKKRGVCGDLQVKVKQRAHVA